MELSDFHEAKKKEPVAVEAESHELLFESTYTVDDDQSYRYAEASLDEHERVFLLADGCGEVAEAGRGGERRASSPNTSSHLPYPPDSRLSPFPLPPIPFSFLLSRINQE